jgi:hypothetical protein
MSWEAGVMMAGVGILWFLGILLVNTDDEHAFIKLFYLLIGVWLCVPIINLGLQFAIADGASAAIQHSISIIYMVVLWIARIVTIYFVLYYLWFVFNLIKEKVEKSRISNGK